MERLRIGTRGSDLALWQARHVAGRLEACGCTSEIVVLKTRGDRIDDVPLHQVEGKGFFTAEIEQALLAGSIDLAVHSHKDLPFAMTSGLVIAAVPVRGPAGERLLIAPHAHVEDELFLPLKRGARVGTSAPRRTAQLFALRPDLEPLDLRGNVPTRVQRLREGRFDAIVLAAAGLERLGLDTRDLVDVALPPALFVPAPAQGALAVQIRAGDESLRALCARVLDDPPTASAIAAERSLLAELGGGCNLPLGALVEESGEIGVRAWRARCFLGAGQPVPEAGARWSEAFGADPMSAARAAGAALDRAGPLAGQAGPLAGRAVALTGSRDSARELALRLETLGARVAREPVLEIEDLGGAALAAKLAGLRPGDALALTSAHAARRLAGLRVPPGVVIAAVGAATARALAEGGHAADVVGEHGARELAAELRLAAGARVLFPCAENALEHLESELGRRGVLVERVVLYRTRMRSDVALDPAVDARVYLSPSAVRAVHPRTTVTLQNPPVRLALGASTRAALDDAGFDAELCAGTDPEDVLRAIVRATRPRERTGGAR